MSYVRHCTLRLTSDICQHWSHFSSLLTSMAEPSVLHVFRRFHVRTSSFVGFFFWGSIWKLPVSHAILEVPRQIHLIFLTCCKLVGTALYGTDANVFCVFQNCLFCWTFSCRHYIYIPCQQFPHDIVVTYAIGRNIHSIGSQPCFP